MIATIKSITIALIAAVVLVSCGSSSAAPTAASCTPGKGEVITTPSGLKYEDLTICEGRKAKVGDTVSVHYLGTLENGTKFDSSFDRNQPFPFQLGAGGVIKGWDEGVAGMAVGSKRRLTIPSDLGYGPQGNPPVIPPNATLIFVVQVMDIK